MPKEQILVQLNPDVTPNGSDLAVVNAARRSFGKRSDWDYVCKCGIKQAPGNGYEHWPGCGADVRDCNATQKVKQLKETDKRLIEFLARGLTAEDYEGFISSASQFGHNVLCGDTSNYDKENLKELLWKWRNTPTHESPFGHCFMSFEIKVPVFVARQLVKHKFLRWSEYSRRYITDDVEFYIHDYREAVANKKQGSGGLHKDNTHFQKMVGYKNQEALETYNGMIEAGIAPEQARGVLPADLMTAVTWSGSLDAFANMCRLRLGSDAQAESRYVAEKVYDFMKQYYPVSAKALVEGC